MGYKEKTFWLDTVTMPAGNHSGPLTERVDVAVIGAGFTGLSARSEEHTSELQSPCNLVCRLLLEKKKLMTFTHKTGVRARWYSGLFFHALERAPAEFLITFFAHLELVVLVVVGCMETLLVGAFRH